MGSSHSVALASRALQLVANGTWVGEVVLLFMCIYYTIIICVLYTHVLLNRHVHCIIIIMDLRTCMYYNVI